MKVNFRSIEATKKVKLQQVHRFICEMPVWMKLVVLITLLVTTSGANQNDCMAPLLDVSSVFGLGNVSSPSLAEYPGETNQSCIDRCCQSDSCNVVKIRFSTSDASPNCVLYSCQPTNSCYLASADDIQFFIRQQPPELITPDPPGSTDDTLYAPSGDVSTLTSPRATPLSPEPQEQTENTTPNSSVQTSPLTPLSSDPQDVVVDNSDTQSSDTSSPNNQSSDALASSVAPSNSPASSMPASDIPVTANSLPAVDVPVSQPTDSPSSPSTESPNVLSTESPNVPSTESPNVPSTESPNVPSTESPNVPSTNSTSVQSIDSFNVSSADSPSLPLADSPSLPSTYTPSLPSTNPTDVPSIDATSVPSNDSSNIPSNDSSNIPSTDDFAISILSAPPPGNETTTENVQLSINPTLTTGSTTTNGTSSAGTVPSDLSVSVTLPPANIEETNILQPSVASMEPQSTPDQLVTSDSKAPDNAELHSVSGPVTSLDSTAILNGTADPMDGTIIPVNGEESQSGSDRSVVSTGDTTEIYPTVTPTATSDTSATSATSAVSIVQSYEDLSKNATSSTSGLLPRGISEAMLALLVCSLTFGCVFLLTVVAVLGKRIYDGYQKRHYSRLDYLINGMYN